ncbi:hypothetical protein [Sorangium sp. So ce861]|uniref:hypothetical protein n=1 Tax=Sorangium sp. So ce861 TaxID=3133323 RepID=UPI003F627C1F
MKQPVSRNSFDRLRGYLGVYLQEGAPLVDACWNEGSDIHRSLLRDAVRDAGLEGAAGIELRIDPILEDGALKGLVARGGPGRFYCGGLPVLWPASRRIDAQDVDQEPLSLDNLPSGVPHTIYLEAWVDAVDALDRPDLDDPGLGAERGSFRARVRSRVRVGEPDTKPTNVLLTVQGSYVSDVNVLYRVELLSCSGSTATLVWDAAGGAVAARVTDLAKAYATQVQLGSTEGFEPGTYVRFEGLGLDRERVYVYRVTGRDANAIMIEGHDCEPTLSMADCKGVSIREEGDGGYVLVVEDPGEGGPGERFPPSSLVKDLPRDLEIQAPPRVWRIAEVARGDGATTFTLMPNGLVEALDPWNTEHASELVVPAHPFHTCIEVAARLPWVEGMRVRIHAAKADAKRRYDLECIDTESGAHCRPGDDTVGSYEDRTVVRIIRHEGGHHGEGGGATMTLRLDRPLSFDHGERDKVVPERLIRARRYQGHACRVPIDTLDPSFQPATRCPEGPYSLGGTLALPSGLSLRLSVDGAEPTVVRGDGWTFAARAGGWVEAPVFAPVDEVPRGWAKLAELTLSEEGGYELVDLRPVPAPRAHHGWLAILGEAAGEIATLLGDDEGASTASWIGAMARYPRAQRQLVPAIASLASRRPERFDGSAACVRALEALGRAAAAVADAESPTDAELSRISAVMERLAVVLALALDGGSRDQERRAGPGVETNAAPTGARAGAGESPASTEAGERSKAAEATEAGERSKAAEATEAGERSEAAEATEASERSKAAEATEAAEAPERGEPAAGEPPPADAGERAVAEPAPAGEGAPLDDGAAGREEPAPAPEAPPAPEALAGGGAARGPSAEAAPVEAAPVEAPPPAPPAPAEAPAAGSTAASSSAAAPASPNGAASPAADVLDITALPTRLLREPRSIPPAQLRKWPTLRDVPPPAALTRDRERKLAEAVASLLHHTAAVGGRAEAGEADRAALQAALDALWKPRFKLAELSRPVSVDDAVELFKRRSRTDEKKP